MKGKKEYIILAAIIVAAAAYLVLRQTDRSTYQLPALSKIPKKEISKVEISGPEKSFAVNRKGDVWNITPEDYLADPEKIDRMLEIVSDLNLTAMVSESKNDQRYDLTPEKRIRVKAWTGKTLKREFDVGKTADTFRHTFVKIAGDDRIFHAENSFRDRFETTVEALRDKTVLAFKSDEIGSIKIHKDGKTTTFSKKIEAKEEKKAEEPVNPEKNISQWVTTEGQVADSNKIKSFLAALSDLKCKSYLNDRTKHDLTDPVISITLSGTKEYRLSLYAHGKKEEENPLWPAQSSENNYPFLLADFKAKEVVKDPVDLMPDKPKKENEDRE
jgi:hypothetical protein